MARRTRRQPVGKRHGLHTIAAMALIASVLGTAVVIHRHGHNERVSLVIGGISLVVFLVTKKKRPKVSKPGPSSQQSGNEWSETTLTRAASSQPRRALRGSGFWNWDVPAYVTWTATAVVVALGLFDLVGLIVEITQLHAAWTHRSLNGYSLGFAKAYLFAGLIPTALLVLLETHGPKHVTSGS